MSFLVDSNGVTKSINDNRDYLPLTLANGMRAILVHDPDVKSSSASLTVNVGTLEDGETQGIAHFLEHMLFMGSKKYPDQNA
jgi:secreted Zn-dependent insulinase-like peptidase